MENNNGKFRRKIQQEVHDLANLRGLSKRYEAVEAKARNKAWRFVVVAERARNKRIDVNLKIDEILEAMAQREIIKMVQRKDDRVNKE